MERQARPPRNNTSGYVGVTRDREKDKWRAQIKDNGKTCFIGYYVNRVKAARAYDDEARRRFRDKAKVNFPEG